ncbi:hypothetical protein AAFF_G00300160 [Aldrovandia affinis]|uniref:Uncharacterized protein n=1 Tax=Aldrovandia affinis TaxID=143900 RepID=A0AAD7SPI8_9TELE|nr:hypothetical protein AAFF_G00300160 [Aldrovandia affinis]
MVCKQKCYVQSLIPEPEKASRMPDGTARRPDLTGPDDEVSRSADVHFLCMWRPLPARMASAEKKGLRLRAQTPSPPGLSQSLSSFSVSYPSPDLKFINANPS